MRAGKTPSSPLICQMSSSITVPAQYVRSRDRLSRDRGILTHSLSRSFFRFGWVIAAVASTGWLGLWQSFRVGVARKAAKIPYPQSERAFSLWILLGFPW